MVIATLCLSPLTEIPERMIQAFWRQKTILFEHSGISVKGMGRALTEVISDNDAQTGGSTITMQVAKTIFKPLSVPLIVTDRTFIARKIENELTKMKF